MNCSACCVVSSIYPPEHFKAKYGVDEVHYVDEVMLIQWLCCLSLFSIIFEDSFWYICFRCVDAVDDRYCRNLLVISDRFAHL